jgi:hypothetical protein
MNGVMNNVSQAFSLGWAIQGPLAQTTDQPTTNNQQPTTNNQQPTTNNQQPIASSK